MNSKRLLGVVLCGGKSSRMGQDKTSLPHPDGGSYLQHAIDRIGSLCVQVCIAGAPDQKIAVDDAHFLPDSIAYAGPVTGIIGALQFAADHSQDGCLVTPVDMPYLSADDLGEIVAVYQQDNKLTCAISQTEKHLQPLVAAYPVSLLDELKKLAASADRSLYRWLATQSYQTVSLSEQACHNVNKPGEEL